MDMALESNREQDEHLELVLLSGNALEISRIEAVCGAGDGARYQRIS